MKKTFMEVANLLMEYRYVNSVRLNFIKLSWFFFRSEYSQILAIL